MELSWTALGYWNSGDGTYHHKIVTGAGNSKQFYASKMFTKAELPVGSVIEVANGWQYRPVAWKSEGAQTSRPNVTSTSRVVVTESWWGNYTHRAFNLSKVGTLFGRRRRRDRDGICYLDPQKLKKHKHPEGYPSGCFIPEAICANTERSNIVVTHREAVPF